MISTDQRELLAILLAYALAEDPRLEKMREWQADIYGPDFRQACCFFMESDNLSPC
jgi:ABC-type siderophore export system fused ATPase/permease subunit